MYPAALEVPQHVLSEAVSWRRHLHGIAELAYEEYRTSEFIASHLNQMGLSVHRGLGGTGVVGTLQRGTSRCAIGIRADIDGLRIREQSGVPHASGTEGVMHACGHDGHVSIALAAAKICSRLSDLNGTVHFIFQPGEEGGAGARQMIDDGLFRLFPCDAVYALHNWPALPLGTCVALDGPMMAANAVFDIEMTGRGCHGAMPHEGTDVLLAGCQLVSSLQSIVSRTVDPIDSAVVSATQFQAGRMHNVIPDRCQIRGTARWFTDPVGRCIESGIERLAKATAIMFRCEAEVHFERRYPATINNAEAATLVRDVVNACPSLQLKSISAPPSMASEDFAFMLSTVPGCYFWLGAGKPSGNDGLHSPQYDFNDELLPRGIALWVALIRRKLSAA